MVNLRQIIFSLPFFQKPAPQDSDTKTIAIVGAGTAGLAILKSLLDLPEETRHGWNIVVFERRHDIGGVWLPDPAPVNPPEVPLSPMYPSLMTNTPAPMMTYPDFPFIEGTPMYPGHKETEDYFHRYASQFNLTSYIRFNHEVRTASWKGTPEKGKWAISFHDHEGKAQSWMFDHLVVAAGINHFPHIPSWPGEKEWLAHTPTREVTHAVWYREVEKFAGQKVLVIGAAASGIDMANHISTVANKTSICARSEPDPVYGAIGPLVHRISADISHFTPDGVVFSDGTKIDVDTVLLATGYDLLIPFLNDGGLMVTKPWGAHSDGIDITETLTTNLRYIYPLDRHVFSLVPSYPTNALAFVGLNTAKVGNAILDIAQSKYVAQGIADDQFLASREELLAELAASEQRLRDRGVDPYVFGHRLFDGVADDYQDELVEAAAPDVPTKFVKKWRRDILEHEHLKEGWKRIDRLGLQDEWLKGVATEDQWADLMKRMDKWEVDWEERHK